MIISLRMGNRMTDDEEIHNTKMSNFALGAADRKSPVFFLSY